MKYLVITRYLERGLWTTRQREFGDLDAAEYYAQEMYKSKAEELCVMIYELKKLYN